MKTYAIQTEELSRWYETPTEPLTVLKSINLAVEAGQSLAVMGPSGVGKSTLLNILGTLDRPSEGHLRIEGCDPLMLTESELSTLRNQRLGFVFQSHRLMPHLTAEENVLLPTLAHGRTTPAEQQRAQNLLARVGLAERALHRPGELSGGECQRVAIARAMINQPAVLLCDEPTGNLDAAAAASIAELFAELQREENVAMVIATHNLEIATRFNRLAKLDGGS